jgi:hypothetical protein
MPWNYKGTTISQPGTVSVIDNSGIKNVADSNQRELILIGSAGGGVPKQVMTFYDLDTAINTLVSGTGLTAVARALRPSADPAVVPGKVSFVRVDAATQSAYNVLNGATTVLQLQSIMYGTPANNISVLVKAGSTQGLQASVVQGNLSASQDNIFASAISVQYLGASASGLVNVSNASNNIQGKSGALGSESVNWTADFGTYATVKDLVNFINAQAGWSATITNAPISGPTANYFDDVTNQACKATPYVVTANLDALKTFFNNSGIVTATRPNAIGLQPTAMTASAYLTGGTTTAPTNTDWSSALTALQNYLPAKIVVALTDSATVHAMVDAHCQNMSLPNVLKNRVQLAGGLNGETVTAQVNRAQALNSRRTTLVYPGIQDIDPLTQNLTTYHPYMVAAQTGGILSSLGITQSLTHQTLSAKGLEGSLQYTLQDTDYNTLVNAGVMPIKYRQSQNLGNGFIFVRSVTTWLQDQKLPNVELSMVCNEDYVDLKVANAINDYLVGNPGSPAGVGQVLSTIDGVLRNCYEEGSIVGDTLKDSYGNITVNLAQGVVTGGYTATIPAPMNFFGITASFQIYAKSAQLGA